MISPSEGVPILSNPSISDKAITAGTHSEPSNLRNVPADAESAVELTLLRFPRLIPDISPSTTKLSVTCKSPSIVVSPSM
jgi:hypothetical protein